MTSVGQILSLLRETGGFSRADLARATGLSSAAATKIVAQLIAEGLVEERPAAAVSGVGRPPVMLVLRRAARLMCGIHLSTGRVGIALTDLCLNVVAETKFEFPLDQPVGEVTSKTIKAANRLFEQHGAARQDILGIGIGVPGRVDPTHRINTHAVATGWRDVRFGEESRSVVLLGKEGVEVTDLAALLALGPGLLQPEATLALAEAVNHLAQGSAFAVIADPVAFETAYRAKLASEDLSKPWAQGVIRVGDYGLPDFSTIKPPRFSEGTLTFFAADSLIGLPYRIELDLSGTAPTLSDDLYQPLDLAPIDYSEAEETPSEPDEEMQALIAAMQTTPSGN